MERLDYDASAQGAGAGEHTAAQAPMEAGGAAVKGMAAGAAAPKDEAAPKDSSSPKDAVTPKFEAVPKDSAATKDTVTAKDVAIPKGTSAPKDAAAEEERQRGFIIRAAEAYRAVEKAHGRRLKSSVVTFGCQMNARDSEKLRGILGAVGFEDTEDELEADFILYNTCTVRDNADQHVYGRLGRLTGLKKKRPDLIVGLCGCMMQEEGVVKKIRKSYPVVDLIFGTHNLYTFPELLTRVLTEKKRVIDLWEGTDVIVENLPVRRKFGFKSGVNIMFGCNNFCSYCIVPYVRGRERSRKPEDILAEIRTMAGEGVKEIMLLGQNVNSYGKNLEEKASFAGLLRATAEIDGIERIRFMTSHPKDLSEDLIRAIAETPKVCRHLHLPVQSGSTEILRRMNRRYTRDDYLRLVDRIRNAVPDISLTSDIIVGFPGETEEHFADTLSLVEEAGFDTAFTFLYSRRTGTPAASMEHQIPDEVMHGRFERLLKVVKQTGEERSGRFLGQTMDVLVEEQNKEPGYVSGRISQNLVVHLPGTEADLGKILPVKLSDCRGFYYFGERA